MELITIIRHGKIIEHVHTKCFECKKKLDSYLVLHRATMDATMKKQNWIEARKRAYHEKIGHGNIAHILLLKDKL